MVMLGVNVHLDHPHNELQENQIIHRNTVNIQDKPSIFLHNYKSQFKQKSNSPLDFFCQTSLLLGLIPDQLALQSL